MAKQLRKVWSCPLEFALALLSGKWTSLVLLTLAEKPARFGELRARLPCLSDKVLAERLHDLERKGLIARTQGRDNPRFSVYQLTERTHSLGPVIQALTGWGNGIATQLGVSVAGARPGQPVTHIAVPAPVSTVRPITHAQQPSQPQSPAPAG